MKTAQNPQKQIRKRNNIGLLGVHICFAALGIFTGTFFVARLFTETNGNLFAVGMMNIALFTALFFSFWVTSYFVKRFSRTATLRFSSLLLVIHAVLTMHFSEIVAYTHIWLSLAIICGVAHGIFWAAMRTLECEINGGDGADMKAFFTKFYIIISLAKISFPFTIGAVIDFVSFHYAAAITALIAAILLAFSMLIKFPYTRAKLSLLAFYRELKAAKIRKPVFIAVLSDVFWGFIVLFMVGIPALAMIVFNENAGANVWLGLSSSVFAAAAILLLMLFRKLKTEQAKDRTLIIFSLLPVFLCLPILFSINLPTFLLFSFAYGAIMVIPKNVSSATIGNLMHALNKDEFVSERLVASEFAMWLGRFIALVLLVAVAFLPYYAFQILFFIGAMANIPALVLVRILHKRYGLG